MNPLDKAIWYIESHFAADLTLDAIAAVAGASRFHLTRAFGYATGLSVMRYVRGRRLSEAARALAGGAPDILALALEAGYGSHEAFTRAFRELFGTTPESVRACASLHDLDLLEPIRMDQQALASLAAPRFETRGPLLIAGLTQRYDVITSAAIPSQWQRFGAWIGQVPGQRGRDAYGVIHNPDAEGNMEYLCGVEVAHGSRVPAELTCITLPVQHYAVFSHAGHVAEIRRTMHTIWNHWLPQSGRQAVDAATLEHYGERFDPATGQGGFEIWLPVGE